MKKVFLLFQALVPAFQAVVTLNLANINKQSLEFPKLVLDKDTYTDAFYFYNRHSNESTLVSLTDKYGDVLGNNEKSNSSMLVEVSNFATSNFTQFLIDQGKQNQTGYRNRLIAAGEIGPSSELDIEKFRKLPEELPDNVIGLKAIYNSVPLHSRPISINIMNNAIARFHGVNRSIEAVNHPFARQKITKFNNIVSGDPSQIVDPNNYSNALALTIGFSLFLSCFLLFPLVERVTNAKQVQIMTGVNPLLFWTSNIVWDFMIFFVSMCLVLVCMWGFDKEFTWKTHNAIFTLALVLLVYGISAIPFSYLISFMFKTPASGFTMIIVLNILAGKYY